MKQNFNVLKQNTDGTYVIYDPELKKGDFVVIQVGDEMIDCHVVGNSRGTGNKKVKPNND